MKILRAAKYGFCAGVRIADKKVKKFVREGNSGFILGQVVHNERVVEEMERLGVHTVNTMDEVQEGTVVFSAHGVPPSAHARAQRQGLKILDTTCPFVYDIHDEAMEALSAGAHLVFIGDPTHREVIGYPRDLDRDKALAQGAGTDILFAPDANEMYPEGYGTFVNVEGVTEILEGSFRPGHFRGVATIVLKLLNITKPHVAVFGQKDAQQLFVIQKLAGDLNLDVRIRVAPIVREVDGLALSSRNVYLKADERLRATALFRSLKHAETRVRGGERSVVTVKGEMQEIYRQAGPMKIDYLAFVEPSSFREVATIEPPSLLIAVAVRLGATRLIDNILIPVS